jgi:small subunit ribosomal protein S24e
LSSQEIVALQDRHNALLNRRELKVIIKNIQGQLTKTNASSVVATHFKLSQQDQVVPILMQSETGRTDIHASFYVYKSLEDAQQQLPRYVMLRNMSKEDRKKIIDEEKAARLRAKQAAAAEAKTGKGRK